MLAEMRVGQATVADGNFAPARISRILSAITGEGVGRYYENNFQYSTFSLVLPIPTASPTAGNIYPLTTANPVTQFALWNPAGSRKNLSLLKFGIAIISGTAPAGPVFHLVCNQSSVSQPTMQPVNVYPDVCNVTSRQDLAVARSISSYAGTACTGLNSQTATIQPLRMADFWMTAGSEANVMGMKAIEYIDGDIVLGPGSYWAPAWSGAGTSFYVAYSITWEEIPI